MIDSTAHEVQAGRHLTLLPILSPASPLPQRVVTLHNNQPRTIEVRSRYLRAIRQPAYAAVALSLRTVTWLSTTCRCRAALARRAGEQLGHVERLRQEALDAARPPS